MRLPYFALILFLFPVSLLFFGCAEASKKNEAALELVTAQSFVAQYGVLTSTNLDRYLGNLADQINSTTSPILHPPPSILVLNSEKPFAFTAGSHYVLLSKGLLCNIPVEDELAFVIAHEMGHQKLNHQKIISAGTDVAQSDKSDLELEADEFALSALVRIGLNPMSALHIFERASLSPWTLTDSSYPDISTRLSLDRSHVVRLGFVGVPVSNRIFSRVINGICGS